MAKRPDPKYKSASLANVRAKVERTLNEVLAIHAAHIAESVRGISRAIVSVVIELEYGQEGEEIDPRHFEAEVRHAEARAEKYTRRLLARGRRPDDPPQSPESC